MNEPKNGPAPRWIARVDDLVLAVGLAFLVFALAMRFAFPSAPPVPPDGVPATSDS